VGYFILIYVYKTLQLAFSFHTRGAGAGEDEYITDFEENPRYFVIY
jgi:hypothetical protein